LAAYGENKLAIDTRPSSPEQPNQCSVRGVGKLLSSASLINLYGGGMTSDAGMGSRLPDYARPPLVEVALGVMFRPLAALNFAGLADLRARWSGDYPVTQQQPPLLPSSMVGQGTFPMVVEAGAPPIRVWLLNEAQDRLVQIQQDRLVANWRATDGTGDYPRYGTLRRDFEARWDDFQQFLLERVRGGVRPLTVEVTYINVIEPSSAQPVAIADVLRTHQPLSSHLGAPIQANAAYVFDLATVDGYPSQVTLSAAPDTSRSPSPLMVQISANAAAAEGKELFDVLDTAHEHVVRLFDEVTTEPMHRRWGRSG
jgi:uncharacterized protein (TIGR04255 family)